MIILLMMMLMMMMTEVGFDYFDYGDVADLDAGCGDNDCMIYISVYKGTNLKIYGSRVTGH